MTVFSRLCKNTNLFDNIAYLAITITVFVLYQKLGRDYLFDWDESIYAELGRQMLRGRDFLTSHWNGALWLEKPPLITWLVALSMRLFGVGEFGARFFMPVIAGLTLLGVYRIGSKIAGSRTGLAATGFLGYFNLFLSRARTVNTDGLLLATIVWTFYLSLIAAPAWVVGIIAGVAIFAKGPAGILAILISLPILIKKSPTYLRHATIVFLFTVGPWHLYQYLVNGTLFYTPYLLEQVVRRATIPIEFHMESRWFYFMFLYKDLGLGMIMGIILGVFIIGYTQYRAKKLDLKFPILWWALLPLALFTIAKTRLSWYILPIYPALALLLAFALDSLSIGKQGKKTMGILVVGIALLMINHSYRYIEPTRKLSQSPDQLIIAKQLGKLKGDKVAMLVSASERTAEAILPSAQTISSSFRYGGAPSVVWYADKQIVYFYNYDLFREALSRGDFDLAITTSVDVDKVPFGFLTVITTKSYLGYERGGIYANR